MKLKNRLTMELPDFWSIW